MLDRSFNFHCSSKESETWGKTRTLFASLPTFDEVSCYQLIIGGHCFPLKVGDEYVIRGKSIMFYFVSAF